MKNCFVLMPFKGKINSYYNDIYKIAIKLAGLKSIRADETYGATPIISEIIKGIKGADVILADLTTKNSNVNYELGIAHVLGKPTILVAQSKEDISFDYQHLRIYFYNIEDIKWETNLINYIVKSIEIIRSNPRDFALFDNIIPKSHFKFNNNHESIVSYLDQIYYNQLGVINYYYNALIDMNGSGELETIFEITAESEFSLLRYKIFTSEPGEVNIKKIVEVGTNNHINHYLIEEGDDFKSFYMLIKTKSKKSSFKIKMKAFAENYMGDLITNLKTVIHHSNNYNSKLIHNDKKVKYSFPNNHFFKMIRGDIYTKQETGEFKKEKLNRFSDNKYYFFNFYNYDSNIPEFKIEFKC